MYNIKYNNLNHTVYLYKSFLIQINNNIFIGEYNFYSNLIKVLKKFLNYDKFITIFNILWTKNKI